MYVCCTGSVLAVVVDLSSHIVAVISLSLLGVVAAIFQSVVAVSLERWTLLRRQLACPQVVVVGVLLVVVVSTVVVVLVSPQVVLHRWGP